MAKEGLCEAVGWQGEGSCCAQVLTSVFLRITKATKEISAERRVLILSSINTEDDGCGFGTCVHHLSQPGPGEALRLLDFSSSC